MCFQLTPRCWKLQDFFPSLPFHSNILFFPLPPPHIYSLISYLIKLSAANAGLLKPSAISGYITRALSLLRVPFPLFLARPLLEYDSNRGRGEQGWSKSTSKYSSSLIIDKAAWHSRNKGQISAAECWHRTANELMPAFLSRTCKLDMNFYCIVWYSTRGSVLLFQMTLDCDLAK